MAEKMTPRERDIWQAIDAFLPLWLTDPALGPVAFIRRKEREEQQRVSVTIAKDAAERRIEQRRKLAAIEKEMGGDPDPVDLAVPPTPELLRSGQFQTISLREEATETALPTLRRVVTPMIVRLHTSGVLDDDTFPACKWYRDQFEESGLLGRYAASQAGGGGDRSQPIFGAMARTEWEVTARANFRFARQGVTPRFLAPFDLVVLDDLSMREAERIGRVRNGSMVPIIRAAALELRDQISHLLDIR